MRRLTDDDKNFYLSSGKLTESFLDDEFVLERVLCDYNSKREKGVDITKIDSLLSWIHTKTKFGDDEYIENHKFQHTAKELWQSQKMTGCTDYALLFATFARQIGIPTTILHTAQDDWFLKFRQNGEAKHHMGHYFCECFYGDKWILVDPTFRKIKKEYNPNLLRLSYKVAGSSVYIPYDRSLDLEKKQSILEHNQHMDEMCRNLAIDKDLEFALSKILQKRLQ